MNESTDQGCDTRGCYRDAVVYTSRGAKCQWCVWDDEAHKEETSAQRLKTENA